MPDAETQRRVFLTSKATQNIFYSELIEIAEVVHAAFNLEEEFMLGKVVDTTIHKHPDKGGAMYYCRMWSRGDRSQYSSMPNKEVRMLVRRIDAKLFLVEAQIAVWRTLNIDGPPSEVE